MLRMRTIGPEMLSAASDNDPTNIGTAAAVGARTGYRLSWVVLLIAPMLAVTQAIAARVAIVGQADLQSLTAKRYGRRLAMLLMMSVVVVNVVTIAADVQAGAAGIGLLAGVSPRWLVLPLGAILLGSLLIGRYGELVAVLRFLLVGFLAFGAAAVLAHPAWSQLCRFTFVPIVHLHGPELAGALALVGTTLTSYVYVWETVERGAEEAAGVALAGAVLGRARLGAVVGSLFTDLILWFMLVASAATLGVDPRPVDSAAQAAEALRPLAGGQASDLYAFGLVVSAVVALPVLMATTAYVVGAQFDWRRGLSQPVRRAGGFYAVLATSMGLAVVVALVGVPVIGMLVAASVIGGFGTPLGLVVLVRLGRDREVMGEMRISRALAGAGWVVAGLVAALGVALIVASSLGAA